MATKFLTYTSFEELNEKAVRNRLNRSVWLNKLPVDVHDKFPIVLTLVHNDVEMRCEVVLNREGETAWLDMSFDDYNRLPEIELPEQKRWNQGNAKSKVGER
jgi:hypothetical protein